jgi:hypothetical protein
VFTTEGERTQIQEDRPDEVNEAILTAFVDESVPKLARHTGPFVGSVSGTLWIRSASQFGICDRCFIICQLLRKQRRPICESNCYACLHDRKLEPGTRRSHWINRGSICSQTMNSPLAPGESVPQRERHMIQSSNLMGTVTWITSGFHVVVTLPKGTKFKASYYITEMLEPNKERLQIEGEAIKD